VNGGAIAPTFTWPQDRRGARPLPRRGVVIDSQLRGRVTPRIAAALERRGLRVHLIGSAAYVHDEAHAIRFILAVLPRRLERPPTWLSELDDHHRYLIGRGSPTPRDARELGRAMATWRRGRVRDPRTGRYIGRPKWWQDPAGRPLPGFAWPRRLS
jgi:hypothetical protein